MRYKLVLFDFDGTLADSFPWFKGVFNQVADRFRFRRVDDAEEARLRGMGARELMRLLGVAPWKVPLIAIHMRRLMAAEIDRIPLFPGVDALLRELAGRGVAIAIVSSNSEANIRRALGPELAALVGFYGCGASAFGKEAKLRRVLRAAGVSAAEALYVGDELRDLEAARQAGLAFGAATWGYTTGEAMRARGPDWAFEEVGAIASALA